MEPDKNTPADNTSSDESSGASSSQQAPADALSKTPDELEEEKAAQAVADDEAKSAVNDQNEKKISPIKRFFRKINVYLLVFVLILVGVGIYLAVSYFNSQKTTTEAALSSQSLSEDSLKQLSNTDASVGTSSQTLTIQGNAIIAGQALMRGNLNVAGNIQAGGSITAPNITISGTSNLGTTQVNSLQVAQNTAIQGSTTLRDLTVSGTTSFSGSVTASQLTVSKLILSGDAVLQVPNHLAFTGNTPSRSINAGALGAGGTASLNGSDTTGTVNINTGNSPAAGCFVTITFAQAFTTQPHVIVSPVGAAAGQIQYYTTRTTTGFSICTASAAPANQTFAFDYFVTG